MSNGKRGTFSLLTPPGEGGIAVFAVEGPGAREALAATIRSRRLAEMEPGELAYGKLVDAGGELIDEVIVAALSADRFELNSHAGGAAAAAVAGRLREMGLEESAEPPEEPGLSPVEAEFRRLVAAVKTRRQLEALCQWRAARTAASPEPRARNPEPPALAAVLKTHRVVIAGPVNAGKSTLFNRLAGEDRAIVSPHPGTTRDSVAAEVAVRGLAVELVDTAGLGRIEGDALAAEAQEMAWREITTADLVLVVLDAAAPSDTDGFISELLRRARRALVVLNKSDLATAEMVSGVRCQVSAGLCQPLPVPDTRNLTPDTSLVPTVVVSALTGAGLDELAAEIESLLLAGGSGR